MNNLTIDTLENIQLKKIEKIINKEGEKIYNNNTYFKDLHDMMQNKQFRTFYDKYYRNWGEIEVMMMYMKLYESIENEYFQQFNEKISKEKVLYIVKEIIKNKGSRKYTLNKFKELKNIKNIKISKINNLIKDI